MILGFTGTRRGMTPAQRAALPAVLATLPGRVLHGGADGADKEFHRFIVAAGMPNDGIEIYPTGHRCGWIGYDWFLHDLMSPLVRNRIMAERCDHLLACPAEPDEQLRSGTWATVRYARKADKPITLILPDGMIREERR